MTQRYCFLPIISCLSLRVGSLQPSTTRPSCWSKSILCGAVAVGRYSSNVSNRSGYGAITNRSLMEHMSQAIWFVQTVENQQSMSWLVTPKCCARHVTKLLGYDMRPVDSATGHVPILCQHPQPWFKYVSASTTEKLFLPWRASAPISQRMICCDALRWITEKRSPAKTNKQRMKTQRWGTCKRTTLELWMTTNLCFLTIQNNNKIPVGPMQVHQQEIISQIDGLGLKKWRTRSQTLRAGGSRTFCYL